MAIKNTPSQAERGFGSKLAKGLKTAGLGALLAVLPDAIGAGADYQATKLEQQERQFDLNRAKITHVINLDEQEEVDEGIPVAMNE